MTEAKPSESMAALRELLFVKRFAVALAVLGCRIRVKGESEPLWFASAPSGIGNGLD